MFQDKDNNGVYMSVRKNKKYRRGPYIWDKNSCSVEALKYNIRKDFMKYSSGAYFRAYYEGWLDDICGHMKKISNRMTKEDCREEAALYSDYWEFRNKKLEIYKRITRNNWGEYVFSVYSINDKPPKYWTKNECKNEALKYSSRKQLATKNGTLYDLIIRKEWLNEVCSHIPRKNNIYEKFVYAVEFNNKSVYIGITWDIDSRMHMHSADKHSAINKFLNDKLLTYKIITLIDKPIKELLAGEMEKKYIKQYKSSGWKILNRSGGGELGCGNRKWSKTKCAKIAKRYNCRRDFRLYNNNAYKAALKYKWMDDICTHMSRPSIKK